MDGCMVGRMICGLFMVVGWLVEGVIWSIVVDWVGD